MKKSSGGGGSVARSTASSKRGGGGVGMPRFAPPAGRLAVGRQQQKYEACLSDEGSFASSSGATPSLPSADRAASGGTSSVAASSGRDSGSGGASGSAGRKGGGGKGPHSGGGGGGAQRPGQRQQQHHRQKSSRSPPLPQRMTKQLPSLRNKAPQQENSPHPPHRRQGRNHPNYESVGDGSATSVKGATSGAAGQSSAAAPSSMTRSIDGRDSGGSSSPDWEASGGRPGSAKGGGHADSAAVFSGGDDAAKVFRDGRREEEGDRKDDDTGTFGKEDESVTLADFSVPAAQGVTSIAEGTAATATATASATGNGDRAPLPPPSQERRPQSERRATEPVPSSNQLLQRPSLLSMHHWGGTPPPGNASEQQQAEVTRALFREALFASMREPSARSLSRTLSREELEGKIQSWGEASSVGYASSSIAESCREVPVTATSSLPPIAPYRPQSGVGTALGGIGGARGTVLPETDPLAMAIDTVVSDAITNFRNRNDTGLDYGRERVLTRSKSQPSTPTPSPSAMRIIKAVPVGLRGGVPSLPKFGGSKLAAANATGNPSSSAAPLLLPRDNVEKSIRLPPSRRSSGGLHDSRGSIHTSSSSGGRWSIGGGGEGGGFLGSGTGAGGGGGESALAPVKNESKRRSSVARKDTAMAVAGAGVGATAANAAGRKEVCDVEEGGAGAVAGPTAEVRACVDEERALDSPAPVVGGASASSPPDLVQSTFSLPEMLMSNGKDAAAATEYNGGTSRAVSGAKRKKKKKAKASSRRTPSSGFLDDSAGDLRPLARQKPGFWTPCRRWTAVGVVFAVLAAAGIGAGVALSKPKGSHSQVTMTGFAPTPPPTMSPTKPRSPEVVLYDLVRSLSPDGGKALEEDDVKSNGVRSKAFRWLLNDARALSLDPLSRPRDGERAAQRYALAVINLSLLGGGWKNEGEGTKWMTPGSDECQWMYVGCRSEVGRFGPMNFVVALEFEEQLEITGVATLPVEVGMLTKLESLVVSANDIQGEIPDVFNLLPNLRTLNMDDCLFEGTVPASVGALTKLDELTLNYNYDLKGQIPDVFHSMKNLRTLDMKDNFFSGTVPKSFGRLISAESIKLSTNKLSGRLDLDFRGLQRLKTLWAFKNQLSGPLPPSIGSLKAITDISIDENQLSGSLPSEIGMLTALEDLWLQKNKFGGKLPRQMGNLAKLEQLYLDGNEIIGPIPDTFGGLLSCTDLYLNNNFMTGTIPLTLGNMPNLEKMRLQENLFQGTVPQSVCLLQLDIFAADCTEVQCSCCTECF
mmetsp:Transcript_11502/g.33891  ORF Transcript_11502/g.33891 Transcript_11502/m.33891 type:complete len:1267 (-) Transcript_11502:93-3893(-)